MARKPPLFFPLVLEDLAEEELFQGFPRLLAEAILKVL